MSSWRDDVRQRVLAYVSMAARAESGELDSQEVDRVLSHLFGRPQELGLLRRTYFLMAEWDRIWPFLTTVAPRLLRELSRSTQPQVEELEGRVVGGIDWARTVAARTREARPSLFVCTNPLHTHATPENEALVYLLRMLSELADTIVGGLAEVQEEGLQETPERLGERAASVWQVTRGLLKHPNIRQVPSPSYLNGTHWARLTTARHPLYRNVLSLCEAYRGTVLEDHRLAEMLQHLTLLPASEDTLFELYALMTVLDCLPPATVRRLIWSGRQAVAVWQDVVRSLEVFYNQSLFSGQYKAIFSGYSLDVHARRPDIILRLQDGARVKHLLIEVKHTDRAGYIVDSVYKVLGYLKDFADELGEATVPQALLFLADGVEWTGKDDTGEVALVTPADVTGGRLRKLITQFADL